MDAENNPVRRPGREQYTGDIPIPQKPAIETRADLDDEVIVAAPNLNKDYEAALAEAEEPVTIRIERSGEKFAPKSVECWVNGKGAEAFFNGRWNEITWVPVGMQVTLKRKYVEVLARSRVDTIETNVVERDGEDPRNFIDRSTSSRAPFSVIEDRSPRGAEWLRNLLQTN